MDSKFEIILNIKSINDTKKLAFIFAKILPTPSIVLLDGEIGIGKTQFVKFFARFIDLQQKIISPSFFKMQIYQKQKRDFLFHLDGYYLKENDNLTMYWQNFLLPYVFIEWPKMFLNFLQKNDYSFILTKWKFLKNNDREIKIIGSKKIVSKIEELFKNELL